MPSHLRAQPVPHAGLGHDVTRATRERFDLAPQVTDVDPHQVQLPSIEIPSLKERRMRIGIWLHSLRRRVTSIPSMPGGPV